MYLECLYKVAFTLRTLAKSQVAQSYLFVIVTQQVHLLHLKFPLRAAQNRLDLILKVPTNLEVFIVLLGISQENKNICSKQETFDHHFCIPTNKGQSVPTIKTREKLVRQTGNTPFPVGLVSLTCFHFHNFTGFI